ncbi:MAG: potassium channel family protein, partial [Gaiellaceae bacterium]
MHETFSPRLFKFALLALGAVIVVGTVGYRLIVHEDWISSFYRVVVTVSLTGLDSRPPGHAAELFTVALLFFGVAFFAYVAGAIVDVVARGIWGDVWAERRRRRAIDELRDHFIICGYGRVGRRVAEELRASGVLYVVLDFNEKVLAVAKEQNELYVVGNGTEDVDLAAAGLDRARGLVAASDSDSDNLYITLSARAGRPDLLIVARASDEEAEKKLMLAGADRVVLPYAICGRTMANHAAKPQVAAFLQNVLA